VSGSRLVKRVRHIMSNERPRPLGAVTRASLAVGLVVALCAPIVAGVARAAAAQDAPVILANARSFDVASVKPSAPDVQLPGIRPIQAGGRFTAVGLTVRELLQLAFGNNGQLLRTQVVGGEPWIDDEHFDIIATSEQLTKPGNPFTTIRGLLQRLLQDRFHATVHIDTRDLPIYELALARRDRRPGPQLRQPSAPCRQELTVDRTADIPPCGFQPAPPDQWSGRSLPMALLANNLGHLPDVGRIVRDRTGLSGGFDMELRFTRQTTSAAADAEPGIFTALQEQLGLKLVPARGPVDVIVIDSIGRPEPN